MPRLSPFSVMPEETLGPVSGVLADIDDTLTTNGRLTAQAYNAMERLKDAGLLFIPVTGRPAGWCDHIARMWPVDGVVGENGAFYFRYDGKQLIKRFAVSPSERAINRERLRLLGEDILSNIPGSAYASDNLYREADLAIDFCEDVKPLDTESIDRIVEMFAAAGATAKVSSIHVNGWFGVYDKLTMTQVMLRECFNIDIDHERARFLFVGDSPNDSPMFSYFPLSVGVANVQNWGDSLPDFPAYVTKGNSGEGFTEIVDRLLKVRSRLNDQQAIGADI